MKLIKPGFKILTPISYGGIIELQHIERIARVCYKSEDHISLDGESAKKLVKMLIDRGHEAMLEHGSLSVLFICDRGVSHEIVRHRMASFAQESTRYCNYSKDKFDNEISVIEPNPEFMRASSIWNAWYESICESERAYFDLLKNGETPQMARSVLPNSLKTEIVMTANYREWRHFLKLRCAPNAHPQMREIAIPLLQELNKKIPVIFEDLPFAEEQGGTKWIIEPKQK